MAVEIHATFAVLISELRVSLRLAPSQMALLVATVISGFGYTVITISLVLVQLLGAGPVTVTL